MEAMAAGTFAMIDMTALRFKIMKIWSRFRNGSSLIARGNSPSRASSRGICVGWHQRSHSTDGGDEAAHATMKKIKPSVKMSWTMRLWFWRTAGNASLMPVMIRTKKSKHIE